MSLIFDRFPSRQAAAAFGLAVGELEPELEVRFYDSEAEAQSADPFPGELVPPIVHVERPYSGHDSAIVEARDGGFADDTPTGEEREALLERLVEPFGGRFAGT